ncbi:hypothetical protein [Mycolicibacterium palauense]|uniref:hypothetical protein n=1 Tax=Mycolicibacterium palauense TaxID=2034511 RepID=UPI0011458081|nr:hypothetical protein [Mycolicibacterium palauense]
MKAPNVVLMNSSGGAYLRRWHIIPRNKFFNIYLHHFLSSDEDRALHDHPWWFASLVLRGGYWEHREDGWMRWRRPGSFAIRRADTAHRVELDTKIVEAKVPGVWKTWVDGFVRRDKPAWTLIFTGPKIRSWGFHCPQGWIHWKRFDKRNGCGEQ